MDLHFSCTVCSIRMTDYTENAASPKSHQIQKLKFLDTDSSCIKSQIEFVPQDIEELEFFDTEDFGDVAF